VADAPGGGVEDLSARAEVAPQHDPGVGRVALVEFKDAPHVGAAPRVHGVVTDHPVGDQVVGVLDVEVVDRSLERDRFD
jgi:hypothetical protein